MLRDDILSRLRERIFAFAASRITGDVAEDIAQEVLIVLHEKYADVERVEELVPLSLQIARFKMMAARRKSRRRGEDGAVSVDDIQLPDLGPDPAERAERGERVERLAKAVEQLGDRCKKIIRMKLRGMSFAEIQAELGAPSINTVYTWDFRCRKQLLERLGGRWEAGQ